MSRDDDGFDELDTGMFSRATEQAFNEAAKAAGLPPLPFSELTPRQEALVVASANAVSAADSLKGLARHLREVITSADQTSDALRALARRLDEIGGVR